MSRATPRFYCFLSLPGGSPPFSEPDGAPWVLSLARLGVRLGHGTGGSPLDLLPCKEDQSLNISEIERLSVFPKRGLRLCAPSINC